MGGGQPNGGARLGAQSCALTCSRRRRRASRPSVRSRRRWQPGPFTAASVRTPSCPLSCSQQCPPAPTQWQRRARASPPLEAPAGGCADVPIAFAVNGQQYALTKLTVAVYDAPSFTSLAPLAAPSSAATVVLRGVLPPCVMPALRFGVLPAQTATTAACTDGCGGSVDAAGGESCVTIELPPSELLAAEKLSLQVSLNGQAWSATSLALLRYPPPHVTALAPGGVLAGVGGTEITVRGSGLLGTEDWPELSPECRLVGAEDAATAYASETAARATCVLVGGAASAEDPSSTAAFPVEVSLNGGCHWTEDGRELLVYPADTTCPNECSGHGTCDINRCECNEGYGAGLGAMEDCSSGPGLETIAPATGPRTGGASLEVRVSGSGAPAARRHSRASFGASSRPPARLQKRRPSPLPWWTASIMPLTPRAPRSSAPSRHLRRPSTRAPPSSR